MIARRRIAACLALTAWLVAWSSSAAAVPAEKRRGILFTFSVPAQETGLSWLADALPRHIQALLRRYGIECDLASAQTEESGSALTEDAAPDALAKAGYGFAVRGRVLPASAALRVAGSMVYPDGTEYPFSFNGKVADLPALIAEPAYLFAELLRSEPAKRFMPVEPAAPLFLLSSREISFGSPVPDAELGQRDAFYQSAVRIDPHNADAYQQLGSLYARARQWDKAISFFEKAIQESPKSVAYHNSLGMAYLFAGRTDEAQGEFLQSTIIDDKYVEGFYNLSIIQREAGDLTLAEATMEKARAIRPDYPLLPFGTAILLYLRNRKDEAAQVFEALLDANARFSEGYNNLGIIHLAGGDQERATKEFYKALSADPANTEAINNLGIILYLQGKYAEATERFRDALGKVPQLAGPYYYNVGCGLLRSGDLKSAADHFQLALQSEGPLPQTLTNLGLTRFIGGRFKDAIDNLKKAQEADNDFALAYYNAGVIQQTFGQINEALGSYVVALRKDRSLYRAHFNLGMIYEEKGAEDRSFDGKALNEYLKTLSLNGELPAVYLYLGMIYLRQGYPDLALETIKKSTVVSFDEPTPYFFLGDFFEKNDPASAGRYYKLFLENIKRDTNRAPFWTPIIEEKLRALGL